MTTVKDNKLTSNFLDAMDSNSSGILSNSSDIVSNASSSTSETSLAGRSVNVCSIVQSEHKPAVPCRMEMKTYGYETVRSTKRSGNFEVPMYYDGEQREKEERRQRVNAFRRSWIPSIKVILSTATDIFGDWIFYIRTRDTTGLDIYETPLHFFCVISSILGAFTIVSSSTVVVVYHRDYLLFLSVLH